MSGTKVWIGYTVWFWVHLHSCANQTQVDLLLHQRKSWKTEFISQAHSEINQRNRAKSPTLYLIYKSINLRHDHLLFTAQFNSICPFHHRYSFLCIWVIFWEAWFRFLTDFTVEVHWCECWMLMVKYCISAARGGPDWGRQGEGQEPSPRAFPSHGRLQGNSLCRYSRKVWETKASPRLGWWVTFTSTLGSALPRSFSC